MTAALAPTVGVAVLAHRDGRVLLVRRTGPPAAGAWALPGGKVIAGERLAETAVREVREETAVVVSGLRPIDFAEIIDRNADGEVAGHFVVVIFACTADATPPVAGDDAAEARWVPLAEAMGLPLTADTARILAGLAP